MQSFTSSCVGLAACDVTKRHPVTFSVARDLKAILRAGIPAIYRGVVVELFTGRDIEFSFPASPTSCTDQPSFVFHAVHLWSDWGSIKRPHFFQDLNVR